jgi:hypothetical protein
MPLPDYLVRYVAPDWEKYRAWVMDGPVGGVMFYYVWEDRLETRVSPEIARSNPPKMVPNRLEDRVGYAVLTAPRHRRKGALLERDIVQFNSMDSLLDFLSPMVPTVPRASLRLVDVAKNYRAYIPPGIDFSLDLDF